MYETYGSLPWRDIHRSDPVVTSGPTDDTLLTLVKSQVRIDVEDDDEWLDRAVTAALRQVEADTNRAVSRVSYEMTFDGFPCERLFPVARAPLVSVDGLWSTDDDGTETAFSSSNYIQDTNSTPGRLILTPSANWPTNVRRYQGGRVRWTAGPAEIGDRDLWAVLLLVGHWNANREAVVVGQTPLPLPLGYDACLDRVPCFG